MKVLVAKTAGFCMGVQRALDLVLDASSRQPKGTGKGSGADDRALYTLGPLIHNNQALEALQARGIGLARDLSEVRGGAVVIRAHGAGPTLRDQMNARGLHVIDATCPRVVRCQSAVRRASEAGRHVLIAGDADHAEVAALIDFAGTNAAVISTPEQAERVELDPPVTLVAQTTFNSTTYDRIASVLARRLRDAAAADLEVVQSLCRSTEDRQREAAELAGAVDAVVVVGGRHSANTARLAEVTRGLGRPTFHVETADELKPSDFEGFSTVGVTAGASTPAWVTEHVVEQLKGFGSPLRRAFRSASEALLGSNVLLAAGAASVTLAATLAVGEPPSPAVLFVAFAYAFFAHSTNRAGDGAQSQLALTARAGYFYRHRVGILALASVLSIVALSVAFASGLAPGLTLLAADVFAAMYSLRILPLRLGRRQLLRLRDIPGSKDVLIALAWVFVAVAYPHLVDLAEAGGRASAGAASTGALLLAGAAVFGLSFSASMALAVGDVQSDRLTGRETIAMLIGSGPARAAAGLFATLVAIGAAVPAAVGWIPVAGAGLAVSGLMVLGAAAGRRRPGDSLRIGLAVQTSLLAAGAAAWLAQWASAG